MWGLIVKDLLLLRKTLKNMLAIYIGTLLISIAFGNYLLSIVVIPFMIISVGMTSFQNDEINNQEVYTATYPLSRVKIVTARYLLTGLLIIISLYVGLLSYAFINFCIIPAIQGLVANGVDSLKIIKPEYGLNIDMIKQLVMIEAASLFVYSIFYPVIYKYGCEKSKYVLMSIVMVSLGILSILSVYINVINPTAIDFNGILHTIETHGLWFLSCLVVVSTTISYFLSIKFYKHKDL